MKHAKRKRRRRKSDLTKNAMMSDVYYDPTHSAAFSGIRKMKKIFPSKVVDKWAPDQLAYTLHKPFKKRFPTRAYRVGGLNELWQIDLLEMIPYHRVNNGFKYIFVCIDVFSRFVRAEPIKNKTGKESAMKFKKIIESASQSPRNVQSDFGKEFYNKEMKYVFEKYNINHYTVDSQFKASVVERFNRTLREKLNRYFTFSGKKVWYKILPKIIDTYNKTKHRGIFNKTPISITNETEHELWELNEKYHQQKEKQLSSASTFKVGDFVRISRISITNPFHKNFDQNWSEEVFQIVKIDLQAKPIMYVLQDIDGDIIKGKFYKEELQYIGSEAPKLYRIEKILKKEGRGDAQRLFVKWHGYSDKHNSWINANQIAKHT